MEEKVQNSFEYRNLTLLVRPIKAAILIPKKDEFWKETVLNCFRFFCKVWGGSYFLLIPTNGLEIDNPFWKILEEYSPDIIIRYVPTYRDLEINMNKNNKRRKKLFIDNLLKSSPDLSDSEIQNQTDEYFMNYPRLKFDIDDTLQQQIKQRLSPFYIQEFVVYNHIDAKGFVQFPLTQLDNIAKQGNLKKVYVVDKIENIYNQLIFFSNWGLIDNQFENQLKEKDIEIIHIPKDAENQDLLKFSIQKSVDDVDRLFRKSKSSENVHTWFPEENIYKFCPNEASLLNVGKYYTSTPKSIDEPAILILGDTVEDFCMYYCMSRMFNSVYWLPKIRRNLDQPQKTKDPLKVLTYLVVNTINNLPHSHRINGLVISSLSKSPLQIMRTFNSLAMYTYFNRDLFRKSTFYDPSPWLKKQAIRIIESNNYTNTYTEVFKNNHSIGRIPTPKPKNFNQILPYDHRWITEFTISDYAPPQLHFLGKEIVETGFSSEEARISNTGICYECPNSAFFGGDIDVTLLRPKINIIEPIKLFHEYFNEAGYSSISISDKGKFTQETINKFDSLSNAGDFFNSPNNRKFLSSFVDTSQSRIAISGDEYVNLHNRMYINFKAIQNSIGSEEQTQVIIDELIFRGILFRGVILKCSYCNNSDWYSLGDFNHSFICIRCKNKQIIQKENWKDGNEPSWFYKLDEIVFQGISNNIYLPIMTLSYLRKKTQTSFLYIPEINLFKNSKTSKPYNELDLCCIQDGKIILGECRKGKIDMALIDKVNYITQALLKKPNLIIFSTDSKTISNDILKYAELTIKSPYEFLLESDIIS